MDKAYKHTPKGNIVYRIILFALLCLLLVSFVSAISPFQTNTGSNSLILIYPGIEAFKMGDMVEIDFHVANENGTLLNNTEYNCNFHIFGKNGSHILKTTLSDAGIYDESIILNDSIYSEGLNNYIVWCDSSGIGGFFSGGFYVTNSGQKDDNAGGKWLVIIIALISMTAITGFITVNITDKGLKFIKIVFFILTTINGLMFGIIAYIISLNPSDVTSYRAIGMAYTSINSIVILGFIWNYTFLMLARIYKRNKDKWVGVFKYHKK